MRHVLYIVVMLIILAFPAPVSAKGPKDSFPASCTQSSAPLATCLVDKIIVDVMAHPGNGTLAASLIDKVSELGTKAQLEELVDAVIVQTGRIKVRSWEDMEAFSNTAKKIAYTGTEPQLRQILLLNDAIQDNLQWKPEQNLPLYIKTAKEEKIRNRLYLLLALKETEKVKALLEKIALEKKIQYDTNDLVKLSLKRSTPEATLQFVRETKNLRFFDPCCATGGFGGPPTPPLIYLALTFLEKGDAASAKESMGLCDQQSIHSPYTSCSTWLGGVLNQQKVWQSVRQNLPTKQSIFGHPDCETLAPYDDPMFLKTLFHDWEWQQEGIDSSDPNPVQPPQDVMKEMEYDSAWQQSTNIPACLSQYSTLINESTIAAAFPNDHEHFKKLFNAALSTQREKICSGSRGDLYPYIQCHCDDGDYNCALNSIPEWLKQREQQYEAHPNNYGKAGAPWDLYQAVAPSHPCWSDQSPLSQIYALYKEAGRTDDFKKIIDTLPTPKLENYSKGDERFCANDVIKFFHTINDKDRQENAENLLLHKYGDASDLKREALLDKLRQGNVGETLDYLRNVDGSLPWLMSQDLNENVKKKALDKLWEPYIHDGGVRDLAKPLQIASILTTPSHPPSPSIDAELLMEKYPKAWASLNEILPQKH